MRRSDDITADDLDRPDGNGLKANYEKHDVGEAEFIRRCEDLDLDVEEWGIDRRHDDGVDGVLFDDKMDFQVYDDDKLVALVDVKTKSSPRYMGRFNRRHFENYVGHAEAFDAPVFVVMFQVDGGAEVVHDDFVFHVRADGRGALDSKHSDAVDTFPDGNHAVLVEHGHRESWPYFVAQALSDRVR